MLLMVLNYDFFLSPTRSSRHFKSGLVRAVVVGRWIHIVDVVTVSKLLLC